MPPRPRRFRFLAVFAVITLLALYHFSGSGSDLGSKWRGSSLTGSGASDDKIDVLVPPPQGPISKEDKHPDVVVPAAEKTQDKLELPSITEPTKPAQKTAPASLETAAAPGKGKPSSPDHTVESDSEEQETLVPEEHDEGRKEVFVHEEADPIHWKKLEEHFPVTSTIQLPTGSPKPVPKVQHTFAKETPEQKKERIEKLAAIKEAFTFSWQGYKDYAWMKDELSPVSNGSRNPFAGWGATLVDALDTLHIMGLEDEFAEAVKAVGEIDFTTTFRKDIPLFETTIRYLGGLLSAYDLSEGKHKVLLDKAVELAEILMGAFDTPNRMPVTYYHWMPTYASQPHRAGNRAVLAEIGSLSMEFTRLAQLTKEPKYYDAIARITDAFYEWQDKTRIPGMWPVYVDASGCHRQSRDRPAPPANPDRRVSEAAEAKAAGAKAAEDKAAEDKAGDVKLSSTKNEESAVVTDGKTNDKVKPDPQRFDVKNPVPDDDHDLLGNSLWKRQLDDALSLGKAAAISDKDTKMAQHASAPEITKQNIKAAAAAVSEDPDCIPQGLTSVSATGREQFTLGGMSDSMYEYFPKEYLLLGGLVKEYQAMYEKSMVPVRNKLLYKPMLPPGSPEVLFSGTLGVSIPNVEGNMGEILTPEGAHLTCFAGGMFALGAKIFGIESDMEIAEQLTEGCVWAYNVTNTGIMPESFLLVPCDDIKGCEWNQTRYNEELDPSREARKTHYERQMSRYSSQVSEARAKATEAPAEAATTVADNEAVPTDEVKVAQGVIKRQLGDVSRDEAYKKANADALAAKAKEMAGKKPAAGAEAAEKEKPTKTVETGAQEAEEEDPDKKDPVIAHIYKPQKPLSHEAYVKNRIENERLPSGVKAVTSRGYILRPEAIESVWYMYRISGSAHWREVGWAMFEAVQKHCRAAYGYSAIDDVTRLEPVSKDEMESFWLAETLKYFYLLFADEELVSLDDWVLNTEAHPFRRPDAGE
ncbi:glycoside hydrolase family 47 protein [Aplosporella prunicola CBS 121167]|uniref:alpha-1,2-Mannosidase n=1 Tax=Aplosporella prunicola CBS 121167 TaxID=1176127 RepID=A0A6A6BPA5_9PEZI|nr:glycoside hydrolase family 47 protein [Aplosporella prunicola CBS 121167]KAF2144381.1 glycoside hydrolase family 47 protein [Aplosporella prunicola CBS 121167]